MSRKYNKTFTNLKTVVHNTSILDAQKILVKPFNGQANERTDIIELIHNIENENDINSDRLEVIENEVLGAYVPHNFTTNSTGRSNETEGTAIQLSKAHFIDGGVQIQSLQLPYTLAIGITDQYCHIQFCNANNEIIKTIVSKNTQSQASGDTGISIWDFEEDATAPNDYHIARIILSGIKETSAFGTTTLFRINVVNNNGVDFDNDECCVWNGSGTSYNYLGDVSLTYGVHSGTLKSQINEEIQSLNDNISEISDDIDEINNEVSLIEEFKNNTNEKIENIEERIVNIEDILDGEFVDKTFTTNTTEDTAETAGRGIQLSKNHFIEGGTILKSLSLPYKGADYTRNNQYCHVTFYDENEQSIKKITSFDTQSRAVNASGISKWTFTENNTLPDDYYYAQIALSGSATDNPNIKTGSQCSTYTINVIRKDGNNVTFDDDICQCYGPNGGVMNYLGDVSVEYQGPGLTLAETVVDNSNRISILEEKMPEGVEYHLNDEIAHLSFLEKVSLDSLYAISNGNYNSYWSSNEIDEAETFIDAQCSTFILHEPSIFIKNSLLGVIQIPYSLASDAQCNLKIVCRDSKSNTDLVESLSTNTVDYSLATGNANYFFEPFILPYNADEVIFNFVDINGNSITAPVTLVDSEISNGDQYIDGSSKSGRVFLLQFRPSTHPTQFVRDLDSPRWPLYELLEDGTYSMDFYSFKGFSSIGFNPHPENGNSIVVDDMGFGLNNGFIATVSSTPAFFSCICTFTEASDDAYIKVNGHPLYTGSVFASEDGSFFNTFPVELLLGPNDTIEISPYVKLRAIRFTDGKYV